MEELDAYLKGDLDDTARKVLEAKLAADPELEAELRVREGLHELRLRKKIQEAQAIRKKTGATRFFLMGGILFTLALLAFFGIRPELLTEMPPQPAPALPEDTILPRSAPLQPKDTVARRDEAPAIAETKTTPAEAIPIFPAPNVRGEDRGDTGRQTMLNEIWMTNYPPPAWHPNTELAMADGRLRERQFEEAYIQLQRLERKLSPDDALRLMKGYCLLEMGEGAEALQYFDSIEAALPDWKPFLEWHQGLGWLLSGHDEAALDIFRRMAGDTRHPYRVQSRKVLEVLTTYGIQ